MFRATKRNVQCGPCDESTSSGTASRSENVEKNSDWIQHLRGDGSAAYFRLDGSAVIGRDAACDLVLEGRRVSRRHLRIRKEGSLLVAEDIGSKNGTFLDGRTFAAEALNEHSVLRLGDAVLLVFRASTQPNFGIIYEGVWGSNALRRALRDVESVSHAALSVSIVGQTGTGKEGVAKAIHGLSGRPGALVAVNCATITESLADAQLFGHKRGAFTGASSESEGYFGAASGGTLFLDEVAELPLSVQAKLLRVLQEREYRPVGSTRTVGTDVRVVTASQRTLAEYVERGVFREDLAARLVGYEFKLPPLAERREDIGPLFTMFLRQHRDGTTQIHPKVLEALLRYAWPGNLRELQQVASRAAAVAVHGEQVELEHLPAHFALFPALEKRVALEDVASQQADDTIQLLERALKAESGNVQRAAESLGISRGRAYRLLARAQLDVRRIRANRDELGTSYGRAPGKLPVQ